MKISNIWIAFTFFVGLPAFAQGGGGASGGNGGDAILEPNAKADDMVGRQYRLLDFYQSKLRDREDQVGTLAKDFKDKKDIESLRFRRDIGKPLSEINIDSIFQYRLLGLLSQFDPLTARVLSAPFAMYTFDRLDIVKFVDDFESPLDRPKTGHFHDESMWRMRGGTYQVGRRIKDKIEIANEIFNRMYNFDQVGLYFHEAIYALLAKDVEHPYGQHPEFARETVGQFFSSVVQKKPLSSDLFAADRFEFVKFLEEAKLLLEPGEPLKVQYERGKYYRIVARRFTLEFTFEPYKTKLFETYYLTPKLTKTP